MFNDPNSLSGIMSPYAYIFSAVDVAARADAHAKKHETGEHKPAKHKLPNGKDLLHWVREYAAATVLPLGKRTT